MRRSIIWNSDQEAQGWGCSQCEWTYPIPTLLSDPAAKDAYDRLASTTFHDHNCSEHHRGTKTTYEETFIERMRELVRRGYKPKDAAQLVLQEVMLEDSNNPEILKQARADADEFLLRIREGRL
jgi:hypothetical protein